jgi:hypothetical protein
MTKRSKRRRSSMQNGLFEKQSSLSTKKPRLDPQTRQLSRFYEPLVLLHTLGRTRGKHSCATLSAHKNVCHLPLKEVRRKFLNELAYMCDYDKGGDTVTAIGLESTPQRYVFWVASNSCPKRKIIPFLVSLLATLKHTLGATGKQSTQSAEEMAIRCVGFATPRVKKYKIHLNPLLRKCVKWLATTERDDGMCSKPQVL